MSGVAKALTIAGSDPSGGAGIQADLKTFSAHRVYGMTVITALTAQNTQGVSGVFDVSPSFVAAQLDAVVTDIPPDAVKTGMLSNAGVVEVVASKIREHGIARLVVDPVMVSKSGAALLRADAVDALRRSLAPLALLITPKTRNAAPISPATITCCGFSCTLSVS